MNVSPRALAVSVASLFPFQLAAPTVTSSTPAPRATTCVANVTAGGLNAAFANDVAGLDGADYQRVVTLPDGRRLWLFQDAVLRLPSGRTKLVHNAGLVQRGACFTLLRSGTTTTPLPWLAPFRTTPFHHWYWPLAAALAADGTLKVFVAELFERGPGYLTKTEPVRTWVATVALPSLEVVAFRPAPNPSAQLYGWSVAADARYHYLYGHCYRQFGWGLLGHHACAARVTVARVPRGYLEATPTYWDGHTWTSNPDRAANVAPLVGPKGERRTVNPMQVTYTGACWLSVTKVADWWGEHLYLDSARSPVGPWHTSAVRSVKPLGPASAYNTYFASFLWRSGSSYVVGLSNNRWDGSPTSAYRPTFTSLPTTAWDPCG
jgi:hypothetical protein